MSDPVKQQGAIPDDNANKKQKAPKEKKEKKDASSSSSSPAGEALEMSPPPSYIQDRLQLFDRLKKEYDASIAAKTPSPIKITLKDGKVIEGQSWRTTPISIAEGISKGLAENAIVSKVNGEVWDLDRVLEGDCTLELLKFDDEEAKAVFWHSSAHMLGEALELRHGGCLCYGPPIEDGFYYDTYLDGKTISNSDFQPLETIMQKIAKEKQPFERLEMSKADLLEMFKYNPFKVRILNEKVKTDSTTVYRCGPLIDLCRGPHVRHTGKVKAMAVTKASASYWEGNVNAESLNRVYGISFPDPKELKVWLRFQEEAAKRDHRKLGREQELFFFHELSPGSCFFLPHGARIYNKLMDYIRSEYWQRGFTEVITPNMYNTKLWEKSGHWQHYSENMFSFDVEKELYALKPMNCPGHCLMFDHRSRSYKELPIRFADFGVLHRNEYSGALTGLTRVRRFQQDDAHIFCTPQQLTQEIDGALDFLRAVYTIFGFSFQLRLSTRPEKFMGDPVLWDQAEKQLADSLDKFGQPWKLNPGDGAFYGPKIDITILDALKRPHQCATIQLDFQLPRRFNLLYVGTSSDERHHPIMIHRAILGSVERMIAILTENFAGKWPFWLSPRQVCVATISEKAEDYAREVRDRIHKEGYHVELDVTDNTINKKVRNAQLSQFNFILVVGEAEMARKTVNVRTRDNKVHGEKKLEEVFTLFQDLIAKKALDEPSEEESAASSSSSPAPASSSSATQSPAK